jgi:hypothetical protein
MPAVHFDHVRPWGMSIYSHEQAVRPRARNKGIAAPNHEEATGGEAAQILCRMRAQEGFRVISEAIAFLHGPMLDDARRDALPDHQIPPVC